MRVFGVLIVSKPRKGDCPACERMRDLADAAETREAVAAARLERLLGVARFVVRHPEHLPELAKELEP